MAYIKKFESYTSKRKLHEIIKESVLLVDDMYKVRTGIDIPQSLINSYIKKVKDNTGKDLRKMFSDTDIAEEIVKYVALNNIDAEKIPATALTGGSQVQTQKSGAQVQMSDGPAQVQPAQAQVQMPQNEGQPIQVQPQGQVQGQPAQAQPQGQAQPAQGQAQPVQGQPQSQGQPAQAQPQGEFEDVDDDDEDRDNEFDDEEDLPI